ncbi:MAG TPA: hypothetical protein VLA60_04770, partial [Nitrospirales bacterium]|nr:hypothetical protein [Nitrospirales bacterium]
MFPSTAYLRPNGVGLSIFWIVLLLSGSASFGEELQLPVNTCPSEGKPIHIHVHGIKSAAGSLKAVLYGPDPESFLVKGA